METTPRVSPEDFRYIWGRVHENVLEEDEAHWLLGRLHDIPECCIIQFCFGREQPAEEGFAYNRCERCRANAKEKV